GPCNCLPWTVTARCAGWTLPLIGNKRWNWLRAIRMRTRTLKPLPCDNDSMSGADFTFSATSFVGPASAGKLLAARMRFVLIHSQARFQRPLSRSIQRSVHEHHHCKPQHQPQRRWGLVTVAVSFGDDLVGHYEDHRARSD